MQQNKNDIVREIVRFVIVGGLCTVVDYSIFNLVILKNLDVTLNLFISTTLGFLAGLLVNWSLQKFVYRYLDESQTKSKKVFLKFFIISVIGLGITQLGILLAEPIYDTYYWTIIITFDFWKLFMKCLMTGIVLVFNYLCRKFYVFKK